MDKAFDAFLKFNKGAIGHDVDYAALDARVLRIFDVNRVPRIAFLLLQTQGDALALAVDVEDHHLNLVTLLHNFAWMRHPAPAHVSDVQQAVHAVQIDESAKISDVLDNAAANLLGLQFLQQLGALLGAFLLQQFAPRQHDVAPLRIDLQNLELLLPANVVIQVADWRKVNLRTRQKRLHADVDNQAAFNPAANDALNQAAFLIFADDPIPRLLQFGLLNADDRGILLVFNLLQKNIHDIADLNRLPILEVLSVDEALGFVADVQQHAFISFGDDLSADDAALGIVAGLLLRVQEFLHGRHVVQIDLGVVFAHNVLVMVCCLVAVDFS